MRRYGRSASDSGTAPRASVVAASELVVSSSATVASGRSRKNNDSSVSDVLYAFEGLVAAETAVAREVAAVALAEILTRQQARSIGRQGFGHQFVHAIGTLLGNRHRKECESTSGPTATASSFKLHWSKAANLAQPSLRRTFEHSAWTVLALLICLYLLSSQSSGTLLDVMAPDCVLLCAEGLRLCAAAQTREMGAMRPSSASVAQSAGSALVSVRESLAGSACNETGALGESGHATAASSASITDGQSVLKLPLRKGYGKTRSLPTGYSGSSCAAACNKDATVEAECAAPDAKRRRLYGTDGFGAGGDSDAWGFSDGADSTAPSSATVHVPVSRQLSAPADLPSALAVARTSLIHATSTSLAGIDIPPQLIGVLDCVFGSAWLSRLQCCKDGSKPCDADRMRSTPLAQPRGRFAALLDPSSCAPMVVADLCMILIGRLSLFLLQRLVSADVEDVVDVTAASLSGEASTASLATVVPGAGEDIAALSASADSDLSAAIAGRIALTRRAVLQLRDPLSHTVGILASGVHREWAAFRAAEELASSEPTALACWLSICEDISLVAAASSTVAASATDISTSSARFHSAATQSAISDSLLLDWFLHGLPREGSSAHVTAAGAPCKLTDSDHAHGTTSCRKATTDGRVDSTIGAGADPTSLRPDGVGDVLLDILAWAVQPSRLLQLHRSPVAKLVQGCLMVWVNCTNGAMAGVRALMAWNGNWCGEADPRRSASAIVEEIPRALHVLGLILDAAAEASAPNAKAHVRPFDDNAEATAAAAFNTAVLSLALLANCVEQSDDAVGHVLSSDMVRSSGGKPSAGTKSQDAGFARLLLAACRLFGQHYTTLVLSLADGPTLSSSDASALSASGAASTGSGGDSVVLAAYAAILLAMLLSKASASDADLILKRLQDEVAAAHPAGLADCRVAGHDSSTCLRPGECMADSDMCDALQLTLRTFARLQKDAGLLTADVAAHLASAEAAVLHARARRGLAVSRAP